MKISDVSAAAHDRERYYLYWECSITKPGADYYLATKQAVETGEVIIIMIKRVAMPQ